MYRRYENPFKLEDRLNEAKKALEERIAEGADMDSLIDYYEDIYDLEERIRFAWDDDEFG